MQTEGNFNSCFILNCILPNKEKCSVNVFRTKTFGFQLIKEKKKKEKSQINKSEIKGIEIQRIIRKKNTNKYLSIN